MISQSTRKLLPALAALSLAACASTHGIAPEGTMRSADRLHSERALGNTKLSNVAWPGASWWNGLGDAQLDRLIKDGLADSPSVAAANARVRKAFAQAGLAEAGIYPTLGASAQESHIQLPETLAPAPIGGKLMHSTILSLNFSWAPDIWGGKHAKYDAAIGQARAQEVDVQAARASLIQNITQTYVGLDQAYEMRDVAAQDAKRNAGLRVLAAQRVKAGIDNQIVLSQIISAEEAAHQQQKAAEQQIVALKTTLAMLAGQGPDYGLSIERPNLNTPAIAIPSTLPSELVSRRPDVVAARWRVEAASRGIDASKADFYPSLNLSAMLGVAAGNLKDLFGSDALLVYGGPAISLPILDGGRLRNQLRGSDADFDLALAGYDQAVLTAMRDIVDAVQTARALDSEIASARASRAAADKSARLTQQRRQAGLATQLDVLNAQKPLLQLDQQIKQLQSKRIDAWVRLNVALGGGVPVNEAAVSTAFDKKNDSKGNPQ